MSQKVSVTLVDDLDNAQEADETLQFTVDGVTYEMDLSAEHAEAFRTLFEPYTDVARRLSGRKTNKLLAAVGLNGQKQKSTGELSPTERHSLRIWAEAEGIKVADRGRIAATVVEAWREAGSPRGE